jgi:hypothetical protein
VNCVDQLAILRCCEPVEFENFTQMRLAQLLITCLCQHHRVCPEYLHRSQTTRRRWYALVPGHHVDRAPVLDRGSRPLVTCRHPLQNSNIFSQCSSLTQAALHETGRRSTIPGATVGFRSFVCGGIHSMLVAAKTAWVHFQA